MTSTPGEHLITVMCLYDTYLTLRYLKCWVQHGLGAIFQQIQCFTTCLVLEVLKDKTSVVPFDTMLFMNVKSQTYKGFYWWEGISWKSTNGNLKSTFTCFRGKASHFKSIIEYAIIINQPALESINDWDNTGRSY